MPNDERNLETLPDGALGLIPLESCKELGLKVDKYLVGWREKRQHQHASDLAFKDYRRDSYIISTAVPRFGTGEAKGVIKESVRGYDLYLMVDVTNYRLTYSVCGHENHMSPDDHYADLKRIIAAVGGKARRITVIIPFLYESRQHKRTSRESLDCALALQELTAMGVDNIITFDAHDPRVQNAIPLKGFETVQPAYQFVKGILREVTDLKIDSDHMMVISPDEGAMNRTMYFSSVLGVDIGMFYKRRDYSTIINGKNPIVAHEYLGNDVTGMDIFIADDIISSGESMLDIAYELKKRNARKILSYDTYSIFTAGLEKYDTAYKDGIIDAVFGTNLTYISPELKKREWFHIVDCTKYVSYFVASLNHDMSVSEILDPHEKIRMLLETHRHK